MPSEISSADTAGLGAKCLSINPECTGSGRIRVVFVVDNMRLGGTELNAIRTAERLDRAKFQLSVVCLDADGPLTARYEAIGVPVETLGLRSFYGPSMLTSGLRFVRSLRRISVDVVHAHDIYSDIFAAVWARAAGARILIASRRWWHSAPNLGLRLGSRFAFNRADAVLANSGRVARSVADEAGIPESKIWTVTNFADENAFRTISKSERARIRLEWKVPASAIVIGCVARLHPVKNHAGLLEAFARVRLRNPSAFLVLVGDGEIRASLEKLARELRIDDAVHFAGELTNGGNYHRGFDVSVLASFSEGFPNSLVEAMAASRPVVATAVGGNMDAVEDGRTGFLVPPGDTAALADALSRLISSTTLRQTMGEEGFRRASLSYRASHAIGTLENMYSHLLAQASA